MIKKTIIFIAGLGCIAAVIWLGFKTGQNSAFVIWFGIASAVVAPIGLMLVTYAFSSGNNEALQRLSRVPEIADLIEQANSEQERIRVLERERDRMEDVIRIESRRQAIIARQERLTQDGLQVLAELEAIDTELHAIDETAASSMSRAEIRNLHDRLRAKQRGAIVLQIGSRHISLDRDLILSVPGGRFLFYYLRMMQTVMARFRSQQGS